MITRARAAELLPIIEAYADGMTIQCRSIYDPEWVDIECPAFDQCEYRIKPIPCELWIDMCPFEIGDEKVHRHAPIEGPSPGFVRRHFIEKLNE